MKLTPVLGMITTIFGGLILGCFYWFFVIYRYFDKTSKFCIVEAGSDIPNFYDGQVPSDLKDATNVSKMLYINMLGIGVIGVFFGFFFVKVSILQSKNNVFLYGVGISSISYCVWVSFALPF